MAVPNPSFLLALFVIIYLLSLVFFAIVRIATGISIQRLGYFSLRRISYTIRDGVRVDIRALGFYFHRPTFAKPTWISLRVTDLKITIDVQALTRSPDAKQFQKAGGLLEKRNDKSSDGDARAQTSSKGFAIPHREFWGRLTELKEQIKAIHRRVEWLRMLDVELTNPTCSILQIASVQVASVTAAIDTRQKTVDRGRLFRHKKNPAEGQKPAEWIFVLKGVLFTAEGGESFEILDTCSLNIHGFLYQNLPGLRDTSISLKLGRVHIPYDEGAHCYSAIKRSLRAKMDDDTTTTVIAATTEKKPMAGYDQYELTQTVSDYRHFLSSTLRGIQEIQLAISFIGLVKQVRGTRASGKPLFVNFAMNEFGIDLFRLDPKGPAHRTYFSPDDVAHQALLAAISVGISVEDSDTRPERLLYVPMVTTTVRTTLPNKTIVGVTSTDATARNTNILFANLVVTSPSIDVDLKHMSVVLALLERRAQTQRSKNQGGRMGILLFPELLPKANIQVSIQEPVARVLLPPLETKAQETGDYDLLISSITAISVELQSSHNPMGEANYSLDANLRVSSHRFYYQTASGIRHDLLRMTAFEIRSTLTAIPLLSVSVTGSLETFFLRMIRSEVREGLYQVMKQLSRGAPSGPSKHRRSLKHWNLLRSCPPWLIYFTFRCSRLEIEVAGTDAGISEDLRGLAVQMQAWAIEYKYVEKEVDTRRHRIRRAHDSPLPTKTTSTADGHRSFESVDYNRPSDSRKMTTNFSSLEIFTMEGADLWEPDPFFSVPKLEASVLSMGDAAGLSCHVTFQVQAVLVRYSLYGYYVLCVAFDVLQRAFQISQPGKAPSQPKQAEESHDGYQSSQLPEVFTIEVKLPMLQVKAALPHETTVMVQIFNFEMGLHRWTNPFFKARAVRFYSEAPGVRAAWARLLSVKNIKGELRDLRRKAGHRYAPERSFDTTADLIRLAVPHQVVLYKIIDSAVNTFKATEQLNYRFKTKTDRYILSKAPQGPRKLPKISLRAKMFMFELEDGLFEWKLGLIYRVGISEQKQRLAREDAFRLKVKNMRNHTLRRDSSRNKPLGVQESSGGSRPLNKASVDIGEGSDFDTVSHDSGPASQLHSRRMRYATDAVSGLTGSANVSADDAWVRLQKHNCASWKKRISSAMHFQRHSANDTRSIFWGNDEAVEIDEDTETILSTPERPGLMTTLINDLHVVVDKPSFPVEETSAFLHRVGKSMPVAMEYALLIPMSLVINMGETRVTLRNYPLPLLHIPPIRPEQSSRLPSWSVKTDFVIAEEFRDEGLVRHAQVEIVPPGKISRSKTNANRFCIDVRRTISPVKTYSDVDVAVNTINPTSITWGTSYQPAIQDMMQIIESFTKPQCDPSERVGFWDKIRLILHSRVQVSWCGGGDVHLRLKGSRDPYAITGHGAGFVMCFRSGVKWTIHQDDEPKRFMQVNCGEYVLAIPDYSRQARRQQIRSTSYEQLVAINNKQQHLAMFKKVIMKLSGSVRWVAGVVLERNDTSGGRTFDFIPHYEVTLRTPNHVKSLHEQNYDAFRGFRSDFIHLSIAVMAPDNRDWSVTNNSSSPAYNSMHMSPKFFTHFFDWWSLFSGIMSLPIRQGNLFPGCEKSSKKFGRHLGTIKYNLLLAPLFISHIYKHKDVEDYASDTVGATGLKFRLESFMLDLHQRREEFATQGIGRLKVTKTSGMRINEAQVDFLSADIRAVSASIKGTAAEDLKRATDEDLEVFNDQIFAPSNIEHFDIPDEDDVWIDMDDFVELDWILPTETHPATQIIPLAFTPRFTYLRQTESSNTLLHDGGRSSRFGDEPTHMCIMTSENEPQQVQQLLIQERLSNLHEQLRTQCHLIDECEQKLGRESEPGPKLYERHRTLQLQRDMIEQRISFMQNMHRQTPHHLQSLKATQHSPSESGDLDSGEVKDALPESKDKVRTAQIFNHASEFDNRFIVHNVKLKWNNSLRNVILRYVHQVSQRRGFVYYMSRRAVKFILDIIEEQQRIRHQPAAFAPQYDSTAQASPATSMEDGTGDFGLEERIQELLKDGRSFVAANDPKPARSPKHNPKAAKDDLAEEFTPQNSYHVRLIAPQIQLQSEKNAKSALLVTGREMHLRVIQIMDKNRIADDVSGLVQRRFTVDMDGVQFFVTSQDTTDALTHFYSIDSYGTPKGSAWPPWAPMEVNFDFQLNPFGWSRVVQKTSASLRYDKYNTLRLKYNDEVNKGHYHSSGSVDAERRIDHIWVEFPHIRATCDSTQYYSMYVIVLDLLLYSEPLEKIRSERLEKIMLAADFSDLSGTPEMVTNLQDRVRQLEEIKSHFQLHAPHLDRQGWQDRLAIERDLASCEDELFFIMKAITTSQRKYDDRAPDSQTNSLLRWNLSASEIVWHLMRVQDEPLLEIQLQHAAYDRIDNSDGSNKNSMEIERIHGLNLLPNATYPEMIAPYLEPSSSNANDQESIKMFQVRWVMLEAIAGIPVLDQFEVNLFPLKIQLEREIGKKLFEYIFPENSEGRLTSPSLARSSSLLSPDADSLDDSGGRTISRLPRSASRNSSRMSVGAGSLELRLQSTMTLPLAAAPPTSPAMEGKSKSSSVVRATARHTRPSAGSKDRGVEPLLFPPHKRSVESFQTQEKGNAESSTANLSLSAMSEKSRKFAVRRASSPSQKESSTQPTDELTEMMSRASSYMTLAYAKVPSVVLCLSYKGRAERNIEDVHNFVFRMPTLEYRNKTWSNLDLALRLKKDVVKALISHTGAIIGNKLHQHRPSKPQQSKNRELASSSSLVLNRNQRERSSPRDSPADSEVSLVRDRPSLPSISPFIAGWGSHVKRTGSSASSMISPGNVRP